MARLARLVVPGMPHHVTQRGNRRQQTFFNDRDYAAYLELMADWCRDQGVEIWSYCLLPNHIHLVAVPSSEEGLRWAVGEAHRRYTRRINFREKWRGYLWQGRFASFVMDEPYLLAAARYVELNPVRARLVASPADWPWSSAGASVGTGRSVGESCSLVGDGPGLGGLPKQCHPGRGAQGDPSARSHGPAAGRRELRCPIGGDGWAAPQAAEAWSQTEASCELSYVSPEFPSAGQGYAFTCKCPCKVGTNGEWLTPTVSYFSRWERAKPQNPVSEAQGRWLEYFYCVCRYPDGTKDVHLAEEDEYMIA